jgi:DNA-binding LytR/AlgR family response regulator
MNTQPTALIADDEPLLRDTLAQMLAHAWPQLRVVAQARNGREAVEQYQTLQPDICFLAVEAALKIGRGAQLVFVTAFDQYAVQAFERGAIDYLVKPVLPERLAQTVLRLQERMHSALPAQNLEALLTTIAARLNQHGDLTAAPAQPAKPAPLRWIRASVGPTLRLILVDDIDYLRSDEKYTLVAWRGDGGQSAEALIRTPLRELLEQLDPQQFAQVHRSAAVNLHAISHVTRGANETADVHLKGRPEVLRVSRSYLHLFKQM